MIKEVIIKNEKYTEIKIDNNNYVAILPNYEDWCFIKI